MANCCGISGVNLLGTCCYRKIISSMHYFPYVYYSVIIVLHVRINLVESEQSVIEEIILFDNYDGFLMSVFSDRHSHEQHDKRKMITDKTSS